MFVHDKENNVLEQYFSSQTLYPDCLCSTGRQNKFLSRGGLTGVAMVVRAWVATSEWVYLQQSSAANFSCRPATLSDDHVGEYERAAGSWSSTGYWAQLQSKYIPFKWRAAHVANVIVRHEKKSRRQKARNAVSLTRSLCSASIQLLWNVISSALNVVVWLSDPVFPNFAGC